MEKVDDCKGAIESAARSEERDTVYAPGKRTTKRRWIWSTSHWQAVEIVFFVILIIVVWGLFALPTLFYLLHTPGKQVSSTAAVETKCTPVHYAPSDDAVCLPLLQQYKKCIPTISAQDGIYISSKVDLQESENAVRKIKSFESFLSPQCRAVALPFACLLFFPLCDDNQIAYLPSSDECISISTESCKGEWEEAKKLVGSIPDCTTLPDVSHCKVSIVSSPSSSILTSANCSKHFVFIGNHCLPACPSWILRVDQSNAEDIFLVVAVVVGLICGILVIFISFVRRRRMLVFPSILVVYQSFATVIIAIFAVIGFAGAKSLYCIAPDWTASLNSSTPFCNISGTVLFYGLMQIAFIWVCHVCFIFWSVRFPLSFMQFKSQHKMKFLHALVICLMMVVPIVPVAAVFGTGGFINARFPPLLCLSKNTDAAFYGLFFPMSILLASGVSLMIGAFWTIRKRLNNNNSMLGSADKKVFIVFCYYVVLGVVALAAFVLNSKTSPEFITSLAMYFSCERETPRQCESYRKNVLKFTYPGISDTMYIILALYPLVNLVYAFDFLEFRHACSSFLQPSQLCRPIVGKTSKLEQELQG